MSPFKAQFGYQPSLSPGLPSEEISPAAEDRIKEIIQVQESLRKNVNKAQKAYKNHADKRRGDAPSYQIG